MDLNLLTNIIGSIIETKCRLFYLFLLLNFFIHQEQCARVFSLTLFLLNFLFSKATEGGNSTSTRFFLGNNNNGCGGGFNNGGFNGGFNNGGFNNGGFNNGGFNNGGFNGGFNNGGQGCQCTQLTINNGREGACRSRDNTGN